jgi:hypothetical protein
LCKIHSNMSSHPRLGLPGILFPSGSTAKIFYILFICSVRAAWTTHLTVHVLIIPIIFGEAYELWSSSLCSLLQPPANSSILGPNILLNTVFSLSNLAITRFV